MLISSEINSFAMLRKIDRNKTDCNKTATGAQRSNTILKRVNGTLNMIHSCNHVVFSSYFSVKAEWSSWSSWSSCTQPCGSGALKRRRVCSKSLYGGENTCNENEKSTSLKCNFVKCPGKIFHFSYKNGHLFPFLKCLFFCRGQSRDLQFSQQIFGSSCQCRPSFQAS